MTRVSNDKVRPFGHHAYRPVFGFVEPHPGLGFDGQRTMGVVANVHWIYGGFRSLDGEKYYSFVRHYNNHGALGFTAFEADTDVSGEDSDFRFDRRSTKAFLGAVLADQRDGMWGVRDIFEGAPRFEVRGSPTQARWFERDLVDVNAEPVGTAIQSCVPDAEWPLVYNHRALRARGTFLGRDVEGYMQMDYACLPDGKDWYSGPYLKDLQGVWPYFTTEYSDGNFDHGMFYCGKERFNGFCVESTDRDPVVVLDPEFEVEFDNNEYPIRFSVDVGNGEVWDWTRPPGNKARIPSTNIEHSPRWTQGRITRRGETREVKSADAWMESFKHRLEELI